MWLLNVKTLTLEAFHGSNVPKYAILSHKWQANEPNFTDATEKRLLSDIDMFSKLEGCCTQALLDRLSHVWIDTCCIDKTSSAELSEAINSMFQWYKKAEVCYAYLYDVTCEPDDDPSTVDIDHSVWFTRGWTLQELLAPRKMQFFDSNWTKLGSKADRWTQLQRRTRIPKEALLSFRPQICSTADIFCWAAYRQTTHSEDRAYSLFGLFDVQMPLLYGEGERALSRLNDELKRSKYDQNLLKLTENHTDMAATSTPKAVNQSRHNIGLVERINQPPAPAVWIISLGNGGKFKGVPPSVGKGWIKFVNAEDGKDLFFPLGRLSHDQIRFIESQIARK